MKIFDILIRNENKFVRMEKNWGRSTAVNFKSKIGAVFVLIGAPLMASIFFMIFNTNLTFKPSMFMVTIGWILFQMVLYLMPDYLNQLIPRYVGGQHKGQLTPAGHVLEYNINGFQAWLITHGSYLMLVYFGFIKGAYIVENWFSFFVSANVLAYMLTVFSYIKAINWSNHPEDNKVTSCWYYNLVMGIEFNPRIYNIDFKLFFNGRPGIILWTLFNLSCVFHQYDNFGQVTWSILIVNLLQGAYVLDFFWNEQWYLQTIDIAHDHFGFYFCWGDLVWLPFMYTLQSLYLATTNVDIDNYYLSLVFLFGLFGYAIFRLTNYQKNYFRKDPNTAIIFNKKATYIAAKYLTKNGKEHTSYLLTSGMWGLARHINYTGDIMLSTSYCLACGWPNSILDVKGCFVYFYAIYMTILLVSRCSRDEDRCQNKYGEVWERYCKVVKYRFVPHLV